MSHARNKIIERAEVYQKIRQFFAKRGVLEVETPVLSQHTVTDCYIDSFHTEFNGQPYYLQTSPEYAMKRLLAEDVGAIFQICKAFRIDEVSKQHNPEFTMIEWYQPGYDHYDLMQEVNEFLQAIIGTESAEMLSYQQAFLNFLQIDPLNVDIATLKNKLTTIDEKTLATCDLDTCLQLLFGEFIEPNLGLNNRPTFIFDFPKNQAALAKISKQDPRVAERFEVYMNGIELANGFHELSDADEQLSRFQKDQNSRKNMNKNVPSIDMRLIAALKKGLPGCAGVALGLDRLIMLKTKSPSIKNVLCFPWEHA